MPKLRQLIYTFQGPNVSILFENDTELRELTIRAKLGGKQIERSFNPNSSLNETPGWIYLYFREKSVDEHLESRVFEGQDAIDMPIKHIFLNEVKAGDFTSISDIEIFYP